MKNYNLVIDANWMYMIKVYLADVFLTTDDQLIKLAKRFEKKLRVKVENPLDWMKEMI